MWMSSGEAVVGRYAVGIGHQGMMEPRYEMETFLNGRAPLGDAVEERKQNLYQ